MTTLIIVVFVIGYLGIALEHTIKVNKTATAILTGVICWTLFMFTTPTDDILTGQAYQKFVNVEHLDNVASLSLEEMHRHFVSFSLSEHLAEISQILFFLLGAMTIVELVDAHKGFRFITDRITTTNIQALLWIICWTTFFLSSILDNLTTTIVMVSLIRKLIADKETKLMVVSMVVIAANAGGAWTPIGDVTTTMLWIGGQITALNIVKALLLPSVVCLLVPLIVLTFFGKLSVGQKPEQQIESTEGKGGNGKLMLIVGVGALVSVPIFKTLTHMPPYTGILLGLGILWVVSELINPDLDEEVRKRYSVAGALSRVDVPSVLFFLGILMAVGALESMQVLQQMAHFLDSSLGDQRLIVTLIGMLSAIVDNVPLVAASMGMYDMQVYPTDHMIWEYLAYCAGTGGSILIIGSAAGVAAMGIERIDFLWYTKKVGWLALIGYIAGAIVYNVQHALMTY